MCKLIYSFLFFFFTFIANAQTFKLADASEHYKTLQKFSSATNSIRAWMDTIQYPPAQYGSSIVYMLVKPYYLSEKEVKGISESVSFPANSSDQVQAELEYLMHLQQKRTDSQIERVEFLGNIGYWPSTNLIPAHPSYEQNLRDLFFEGREVLGENVNAANFPKVSQLLENIMQDMRVMEFTIKYKFYRPRPYHLEPRLEPLAKINSPSFASGHTLWAFLQAFIWGELIPEKQKEFIALAEEIRRSREIMGIHYPSDNEASRQIAYTMFQTFYHHDGYKRDFAAALSEWKTNSRSYIK